MVSSSSHAPMWSINNSELVIIDRHASWMSLSGSLCVTMLQAKRRRAFTLNSILVAISSSVSDELVVRQDSRTWVQWAKIYRVWHASLMSQEKVQKVARHLMHCVSVRN